MHFYSDDFMLSKTIRELALASLNNYMFLAKEWFNVDLNEFGFSLLPISIVDSTLPIKTQLSGNEKSFIKFVDKCICEMDTKSDRYITLEMDITLKRNFSTTNIPQVSIVQNSPNKVTLSEADMLNQYPLTHGNLVEKLKERYEDFRQDTKFNQLKRNIHANPNLTYKRIFDPKSSKSGKKCIIVIMSFSFLINITQKNKLKIIIVSNNLKH